MRGHPCEQLRFALFERKHKADKPPQSVVVADCSRLIDRVFQFRAIVQNDTQELISSVGMGNIHRKTVPEQSELFPAVGAAIPLPRFDNHHLQQFLIIHIEDLRKASMIY